MKTELSKAIAEVWALKRASAAETEHLKNARDYFEHIRSKGPAIDLPRLETRPQRISDKG